jgi:hypothetical protein
MIAAAVFPVLLCSRTTLRNIQQRPSGHKNSEEANLTPQPLGLGYGQDNAEDNAMRRRGENAYR